MLDSPKTKKTKATVVADEATKEQPTKEMRKQAMPAEGAAPAKAQAAVHICGSRPLASDRDPPPGRALTQAAPRNPGGLL